MNVIITNNSADMGGGMYSAYSSPVMQSVSINNNHSVDDGGGVFLSSYGSPVFKDVSITNNISENNGGGIFFASYSNAIFDSVDLCNIYLNNAISGVDLYADEFTFPNIAVDTFSVLFPTEFYAYPIENFSFNILHGIIEQVDADLYVSPYGDNLNSGLTEDDPLKTIYYAFSKIMVNNLDPHTINLLEGTYSPSVNGETFPVNVIDFVNLSGVSGNDVFLDAEEQSRVIEFFDNQGSVVSNLTVTNGYTDGSGGGMYIYGSSPVIEEVQIINNSAAYGAGLYCDENSSPYLQDIIFSENVSDYEGGGIFCNYNSNVVLENAQIINNSAENGGGIFVNNSASPVLENVQIINNSAEQGGGMFLDYSSSPNMQNVRIVNNSALNMGGGIYFDDYVIPVFDSLSRCNIYLNEAQLGSDLFSDTYVEVIVDTFTVLFPKNYHAYPLINFDFDILHGMIPQVYADMYVSPDGDNSNTGLTVDDPLKTIEFALSVIAEDSVNLYTINLLNGTYGPSTNGEIFPAFLVDYVKLAGVSQSDVILDGEGLSSVVELNNIIGAEITNLTITGGYSNHFGGGINCINSNPAINNISLIGNLGDDGGGIYCTSSDPVIDNVFLTENIAENGGGIYLYNSSPDLQDIYISGNFANNGGGVYCNNYSNPQLEDLEIIDNTSEVHGGGLYCDNYSNPFLQNVNIQNNTSDNGGGIFCNSNSSPVFDSINRCNIYLNNASMGSDLYSEGFMEVVVDTFTVLYPKYFHAYPLENFSFDILHGLIPQLHADLYVSPDGDNTNSGLSADDPLKTIHFALTIIAEDSLDLYTINLLNGTYSSSVNDETFPIYIPEYIGIAGETEDGVIIDAEGQSRVLEFSNSHDIIVSNLTINGGYSVGNGGGIYFGNSSPEIMNITIANNSAGGLGGGFYCNNSNPDMTDITITDNSADFGGGFSCDNDSKADIQHATVTNNTSQFSGGGIYVRFNSDLYLTNCGNASNLFFDSVLIMNNEALNRGGGIYNTYSDIFLENVNCSFNSAGSKGGGIYTKQADAKLINMIIKNNYAETGGGIYSAFFTNEFLNVAVSGNTATTEGGGMYLNLGTSDIGNATITSNYADKGGGIYCKTTDVILRNSILWNEAVDEIYFKEIYNPSAVTVSWTDIQGGEDGIIINNNGTVNWLEGNIEAYPLFAGMGDHPYALTASSPCIDTGTPDTTGLNLPFKDLLGNYRIWDGDGDGVAIIDMGAYEFGAIPVGTEKTEIRL